MAYCVKCGVELADSEEKCPLCGTVVYHPEIKRNTANKPFPAYDTEAEEEVSKNGLLLILTMISFVSFAVSLLCDFNISGHVSWSAYVTGALILLYSIFVFPLCFKNPNPVLLAVLDFLEGGLYLYLINYMTGGNWFWTFALPITAGAMIITVTVTALVYYLRKGRLCILGGAIFAFGFFALLIEYLLNTTFGFRDRIIWSFYPLCACIAVGTIIMIAGLCRPLREYLHRKFFI